MGVQTKTIIGSGAHNTLSVNDLLTNVNEYFMNLGYTTDRVSDTQLIIQIDDNAKIKFEYSSRILYFYTIINGNSRLINSLGFMDAEYTQITFAFKIIEFNDEIDILFAYSKGSNSLSAYSVILMKHKVKLIGSTESSIFYFNGSGWYDSTGASVSYTLGSDTACTVQSNYDASYVTYYNALFLNSSTIIGFFDNLYICVNSDLVEGRYKINDTDFYYRAKCLYRI